ncbi:hypothetical protein L195_g051614 [Trifolium pratense]|uniref:Uncharacterized protein n=1 Tax=Trifolium pratense TaxID=57577 RepID=A0A2K3K0P3_TRIPR|nr:hypothetical protein L195_g051614 [Trifolium pratense]
MRNDPTTYDSNKYDDNGERIVMLFGVNIGKKPTKVHVTPKDSSSMENINYIPHDNKDISIVEHKNEDENENNEVSKHENMERGCV